MSGLWGRGSADLLEPGELPPGLGVQIRAQLLQQAKQEDLGQRWRLHAEEAARYDLVAQPDQEFEVLLAQDLCIIGGDPTSKQGGLGVWGDRGDA